MLFSLWSKGPFDEFHHTETTTSTSTLHSGWSGVTGVGSGELFQWCCKSWIPWFQRTLHLMHWFFEKQSPWDHHFTTKSRFFQHDYCTLPDTNSSHLPGCAIPKGNNRLPTIHLKVQTCWLVSGRVYIYLHPILHQCVGSSGGLGSSISLLSTWLITVGRLKKALNEAEVVKYIPIKKFGQTIEMYDTLC